MNINNQQSPSFGSSFLIRKLPVGEKVLDSGRIGGMYEYSTKKLSKAESSVNAKTNKSVEKLIKDIQDKFGKSNKVEVRQQFNMDLLLGEHIIDVDDNLDKVVEDGINAINNKKKRFWQSIERPKLNFAKFESQEKIMARFNEFFNK